MELWNLVTGPVMLPLSVMFGMSLTYWIIVIVTGIDANLGLDADMDMDADLDMDVDADLDVDADVDADLDADSDVDSHVHLHDVGPMLTTLSFFNVGVIPLTLLLSLTTLFAWTAGALTVSTFPWTGTGLLAYLLYVPYFIFGAFLTKALTQPFAGKIRQHRKTASTRHTVIAKFGFMKSANNGVRLSQCEVPTDGAPFLINVKARPGESIAKGARVLVIEESEDGNFYFVENMEP